MRSSTPERAAPPAEIVVEAPTATEALEEVSTRLGPRATILEASKVTRGGIGGFFAREMVQLRAGPPASAAAVPREAGAGAGPAGASRADRGEDLARLQRGSVTTTAGEPTALDRLLTELSSEVNQREETFGETLRRHLGAGPAGAGAAHAPAPLADESMGFENALAAVRLSAAPGAGAAAGAPRHPPAPASGGTAWTADRLLRLGVPAGLLGGWQAPASDLDGLVAFAQRVAPLCGPLPAGAPLLAGPRAHRLAAALGAASVEAGEPLPALGPVCARVRDSARGRAWLATSRQGRWLHLVVGGGGWQRLLLDYPLAVSWCGHAALPDALRVATELGLPLGYGCGSGRGSRVLAASAVEVAVALRELLVDR